MGTPTDSRQTEVREELQRLLESPVFRSSKRCREFLQHIVERTLSGPNGSLKERSIGIELFGLPHDFDSSQHTIVRVTASETRKKLAQYYQVGNGSQSVLRIDLPPGSYNAEFYWSDATVEPTEEVPEPPSDDSLEIIEPALERVAPPPSRRGLILGGGAAAGLAIVAGFTAWKLRTTPAAPPPNTGQSPQPASSPLLTSGVRVGVGLSVPYFDRNGQTWEVDHYFSGGSVLPRLSERVVRTLDPDLYRHPRIGDFRYDIPLAPGSYEVHLHFAETGLSDFISAESSGEGQRVFRVSANGKVILDFFDVVADAAGTNIADERILRNLSPGADGMLHLGFSPLRGSAMVSGIEVLPMQEGKTAPLRIRSGWTAGWRDGNNRQWRADSYFLGGNALVRRTNPARESEPDNGLYASERWGHFTYALPAAPEGRYRLTLKFCEGHLGPRNTGIGGVGSRVFDVHCNGTTLLKDFDIVREARGEGRPLDQIFSGIRPNAQGKILLAFVPNQGMACVNGIELVEQ